MQKTTNYNLNQWEATDPIRREDFNSDNAAIDAALAGKANTADLTGLSQTISALSAAVSGKGNCKIATGSYVGKGVCGEDDPVRLTFDFKPLMVVVGEGLIGTSNYAADMETSIRIYPFRGATSVTNAALLVTWGDNFVSWYCDSDVNDPIDQENDEGRTYYWVTLGVEG